MPHGHHEHHHGAHGHHAGHQHPGGHAHEGEKRYANGRPGEPTTAGYAASFTESVGEGCPKRGGSGECMGDCRACPYNGR